MSLAALAPIEVADHPLGDNLAERVVAGFLGHCRETATRAAYAADLQRFAAFIVATTPADAVRALISDGQALAERMVSAFTGHLTHQGLGGATVKRAASCLRSLVAFANERGLISWRLAHVDTAGMASPQVRGLTREHLYVLLRVAAKDEPRQAARNRAIIWLLHDPGLQAVQVSRLTMSDLDEPRRRVRLVDQQQRGRAWLEVYTEPMAAVREWLEVRGRGEGPLFSALTATGDRSRSIRPRAIRRLVARLGRLAGIAATPQGLRWAESLDSPRSAAPSCATPSSPRSSPP